MSHDDFEPANVRTPAGFYLVQRLRRSPYAQHKATFPGAKVKSNPFGYGRMGDYELDYMGSAEFEFGAIPAANNRLADAKNDLTLDIGEHELQGRKLDFLYIATEGDPWDTFLTWAEGRSWTDRYGYEGKNPPFYGKERPYDFEKLLTEPDYEYAGDVWWALGANVAWAFHDGENGHLLQMLESMAEGPTELRG